MKRSRFRFTIWQLTVLIAVSAVLFAQMRMPDWPLIVAGWGTGALLSYWTRKRDGLLSGMFRSRPHRVDEDLGPIIWRGLEDHDLRHPQAGVRQP